MKTLQSIAIEIRNNRATMNATSKMIESFLSQRIRLNEIEEIQAKRTQALLNIVDLVKELDELQQYEIINGEKETEVLELF